MKEGLERIGKESNKPLIVVGQTGTGKSIAVASVAHKIFNEKKYPVIFINDPDVNFYSNTEYKLKEVNKKGSAAFNALDALIESIENKGAKAVLLVWDTSSFNAGRKKILRLYQALLARGRKVYLVSTAYETNNNANIRNSDEENSEEYNEEYVFDKKFVECIASVDVSDEAEQLRDILLKKCGLDEKAVDKVINYYVKSSPNFLSMFYQAFDMLRGNLSQGVYKEATNNLDELDRVLEKEIKEETFNNAFADAFKKFENQLVKLGLESGEASKEEALKDKIVVAKDKFIKCIAVCSRFKLKMPYDFALRLLGTYNGKIIQELTKSTFFVVSEDMYDNYEISLRTPLEAKMYIQAKSMTAMDEIECIIEMLKQMNPSGYYAQQKEVRLCEKLIRIIGPNSLENRNYYRRGYAEIIEALSDLRKKKNIWEPILISQEITYIREYFGADNNLPNAERIEALRNAIDIADEVLSRSEFNGISMGTRNAIIVESSNSKLLLCRLNEETDSYLYKELRRDLRQVIRYDNLDYHAYVTLMKGSIIEYKNEKDRVKKVELLEAMCSLADEIMFENPDVASSEYFQRQVTEIYGLMDDSTTEQSYIDELVTNGSAAGLFVYARKILRSNEVDYRHSIITDAQKDACEKVYALFNDPKYKQVVQDSESCQYMLLNIVWLINNKAPIYSEGEYWITRMSQATWREILAICNNFIMRFCGNVDDVHQMGRNINYLKALCLGELEMYADSLSVLREMDEDSSLGIKRVFTKHMLCEPDGTIRKFTGRLGKYDEASRNGEIYIDEFGKNPIYYHGPHMKSSKLDEGTVFNDIEIGYSNIAPKAFREVEVIK